MMSDRELVELGGDDGTLELLEFGVEAVGDATKTLDVLAGGTAGSGKGKGFWLITAKAPTGSLFADFEVGEQFPADGDEVPATGDKMKFVTVEVMADHIEWSSNITAKVWDATRGVHKFEKSRLGKMKFSGKIKGIFTAGITDQAGSMLNRYMKIITKKAADGAITISPRSNAPLYVRLVVRNGQVSGESFEFMLAQIVTDGFNLGAASGAGQTFETNMYLTGADPCFYVLEL